MIERGGEGDEGKMVRGGKANNLQSYSHWPLQDWQLAICSGSFIVIGGTGAPGPGEAGRGMSGRG